MRPPHSPLSVICSCYRTFLTALMRQLMIMFMFQYLVRYQLVGLHRPSKTLSAFSFICLLLSWLNRLVILPRVRQPILTFL